MISSPNPFKFGTIVGGDYFTDRRSELAFVRQILDSENHLVLISPRRFGKSSLIAKALELTPRKHIVLNMQSVTSVRNLACRIMEAVFRLYPWEKVKHLMTHFRITPTLTANLANGTVSVSLSAAQSEEVALEDSLSLLEKVSSETGRLIVVLDEFQEIESLGKGLDRQLRSIMQAQNNINYVFLGSQESMMEQIFEKKKSPFYHFGQLMRLAKIPYEEFLQWTAERLSLPLAEQVLAFTDCHPYYTQQLAFQVWNIVNYETTPADTAVATAVERLLTLHDLDFERLWVNFGKQDRRILQDLSRDGVPSPAADRTVPTSTTYSAMKRLMAQGYVVRDTRYTVEDPFFRLWISRRRA